MPVPLVADQDLDRIADALARAAELVRRIGVYPDARPLSVNLGSIAEHFERADRLLEAGVTGGGVKPAQLRGIATQLEGAARDLRGGGKRTPARRAAPAKRTSRTSTTKRATTRKPARRRSGGR